MQALSTNLRIAFEPVEVAKPILSVVIPTFNEALSLPESLYRLRDFAHESGLSLEAVIVDDGSPDGTGQIAEALAPRLEPAVRVKVIHRPGKLGVTGALFDGIQNSGGRWVTTLDADNSHDISSLRDMFLAAQSGADVVVGSRYVRGGRIEVWPLYRRIISLGATSLARSLFDLDVRDPMSGFALMTRDVAERLPTPCNPRASKLLLEVLVRVRPQRVVEVPIRFRDRANGESKFSIRDMVEFVHLVRSLFAEHKERGSPRLAADGRPTHHA